MKVSVPGYAGRCQARLGKEQPDGCVEVASDRGLGESIGAHPQAGLGRPGYGAAWRGRPGKARRGSAGQGRFGALGSRAATFVASASRCPTRGGSARPAKARRCCAVPGEARAPDRCVEVISNGGFGDSVRQGPALARQGGARHGMARVQVTSETEGQMRRYEVMITGESPLLLHHDNIEWADQLAAWRAIPANKKKSKAGDDRSPGFSWKGCLYIADGMLVVPTDNIMSCLMKAGAMVPIPGGKNGKTFKEQTQSGILPEEVAWPIEVDGRTIKAESLEHLDDEEDFAVHREAVKEFGFDLFVKRAVIGQSKHIRVRPRFARWSLRGAMTVIDDQITSDVLATIFDCAGRYKGLGDWRPSSKTPGQFGRFKAEVKKA